MEWGPKNEHTLPDDWINTPGVLVGMEHHEQINTQPTQQLVDPVKT